MAGTRLTVHLLFAVQLLLLVCIACYVGGIMGVNMNKDRHDRRAGMDLLPTHLLDGSWLRELQPFHYSLDDPILSKSEQSTASVYELQSARRQWKRPHVMVTLVDEDPTSYPRAHHAHLSQALTETLDQTLGPMLHQRLSPLFGNGNSTRLSIQTVLHQGTLSSMSMRNQPQDHDPNRKNETTTPYFLELDDDFGERFWNHHNHLLETPGLPRRNSNSNIIHFVVYVPPKNRRPMLVRHKRHDDDDEPHQNGTPTVGTSFTLPPFFVGAVSILNLPDIVANNDDSPLNVPQHYRLAVQQAVSHFGTALRQYMGLRSTTTTTTTPQKEDADDQTNQFHGCSDAELKELCCSSWNIQYPIAFSNIQTQLDRILRPYQLLSEWIQEYIPILGSLLPLHPPQEQHWLGKRVFRWLLRCSLWAADWLGPSLSMHAAQGLLESVSYLEQSHRNANEGQFENAMEDLQRCHERMEAFRETSDRSSMTMPSNFSWEQHMAIFSPLLLPLVLPMVIGLMREKKRYKQLIMAANEIKLQS